MRPLYLTTMINGTVMRTFRGNKYITQLEIDGKAPRHKIKELRDVLKKGERDTELF